MTTAAFFVSFFLCSLFIAEWVAISAILCMCIHETQSNHRQIAVFDLLGILLAAHIDVLDLLANLLAAHINVLDLLAILLAAHVNVLDLLAILISVHIICLIYWPS
jgi:hypothetical protein